MVYDVIVIGGGLSGIHAAWEIEQQLPEANVLVLEAAACLGGRARSVALGDHCVLDVGAHYFAQHHRRMLALARRLCEDCIYSHVPAYGQDPSSYIRLEGRVQPLRRSDSYFDIQGLSRRGSWEQKVRIFESLLRYLRIESRIDIDAPWNTPDAAALDAITVAAWIRRQRVPQWIQEMWTLAVLDVQSVWPDQISLLYWVWYHASNGGFLTTTDDFVGGPQEFALTCGMQALVERHAAELRHPVRCQAPVVAVDATTPGTVRVTVATGEVLQAARVIVAVTPAIAGRIDFTPELSPERQLLHRQPCGHAGKFVARYAQPWWQASHGAQINVWSSGVEHHEIEWVLDTSHVDGRQHSLTGFVSDELFDRVGSDPEVRRQAVLAALADLAQDPRAAAATHCEVFDWRRDQPWVGGGPNTVFGPGVLTRVGPAMHAAEGPEGRVVFTAAEYATECTGYLEGALASAEAVADRVAEHLAGDLGTTRVLPKTRLQRPRSWTTPVMFDVLAGLGLPFKLLADAARARRGHEARL